MYWLFLFISSYCKRYVNDSGPLSFLLILVTESHSPPTVQAPTLRTPPVISVNSQLIPLPQSKPDISAKPASQKLIELQNNQKSDSTSTQSAPLKPKPLTPVKPISIEDHHQNNNNLGFSFNNEFYSVTSKERNLIIGNTRESCFLFSRSYLTLFPLLI
jgi:hypothetical protein